MLRLEERRFRPTTLSSFEKCDLRNDSRRCHYELMSFEPEHFDMLEFGPSGIYIRERNL